jgi:hypothetical protein
MLGRIILTFLILAGTTLDADGRRRHHKAPRKPVESRIAVAAPISTACRSQRSSGICGDSARASIQIEGGSSGDYNVSAASRSDSAITWAGVGALASDFNNAVSGNYLSAMES